MAGFLVFVFKSVQGGVDLPRQISRFDFLFVLRTFREKRRVDRKFIASWQALKHQYPNYLAVEQNRDFISATDRQVDEFLELRDRR